MGSLLKQFQRYTFIRALVYFITGLIAWFYPAEFTKGVIWIVAGYVGILGLLSVFSALKEKKRSGIIGIEVYFGVILIIAALAILVLTKPLLTLTTIIIGLLIVFNGSMRIFQALSLKSMNQAFLPWILYGIILIVVGLFLMFNATTSIMTIIAGILIFMGVSEMIGYFQLRKLN
ncbi:DUF308 domain-containing protein [Enterococcus lemanii]|jgi:uncharacterized membrane protein HdeD (DUF308 family)|uniref:DUF308 domain-containing protein n=1 Tax=Enterococcus lemanii TaxID=1159752 RepID=A0ABV9MW41_9ENTE|nr:DUF308 domain-containing protein [Enterococcus lemanii]MBM7709220.1 uncharacterized membrane protein HdeD (DUF308 family) [Enterococcus lemanii]